MRIQVWINGSPYTVLRPEEYEASPHRIVERSTVEVLTEYGDTRVWVNGRNIDIVQVIEVGA